MIPVPLPPVTPMPLPPPEVPIPSSRPGYVRLPDSFLRQLFRSPAARQAVPQAARLTVSSGFYFAGAWIFLGAVVISAIAAPGAALLDLHEPPLDYRYDINGRKLRAELDPELYALMQQKMQDNLEIPMLYVEAMQWGDFRRLTGRLIELRDRERRQAPGLPGEVIQEPRLRRQRIVLPGEADVPLVENENIPVEDQQKEPDAVQQRHNRMEVSTVEIQTLIDIADDQNTLKTERYRAIARLHEYLQAGSLEALQWFLQTPHLREHQKIVILGQLPEDTFRIFVDEGIFPFSSFELIMRYAEDHPSAAIALARLARLGYSPALPVAESLRVGRHIVMALHDDDTALTALVLLATLTNYNETARAALQYFPTEQLVFVLEELETDNPLIVYGLLAVLRNQGNWEIMPIHREIPLAENTGFPSMPLPGIP